MDDQIESIGRKDLSAITRIFAGSLALSVLVVSGLVWFSLRSQDTVAIQDSVHLTRSMLGDTRGRLQDQLLDYSYWDEAVQNLVDRPDPDWADNNIGTYMYERFGIDCSLVVAPDDTITYAMLEGSRVGAADVEKFKDGFRELIERARLTPRDRAPNPVTGFLAGGEAIHMVGASVLTRFPGGAVSDAEIGTGWVLVFGKSLDETRLRSFEQDYLLTGLRIVAPDQEPFPANLPITAPNGHLLGYLTWVAESPSGSVLPWLAGVIVIVFLLFGLISLVFFRRSQSIMSMLSNNITDLRFAQKARNDALVQAREANEAKTRFLANMSHELRTPLNAVIGLADMMRHAIFGPLGNERYGEYAEDIHASAEHLLRLINDVLDISAIETGKLRLNMAFFSVHDSINECIPIVSQSAEKKGIEFTSDIQPDLPQMYGHQRSLTQILINLLGNAIKYTPSGGSVSLSARFEDGDHVFVVRDTGMGIPPNKLPTITDPYTRAHSDPALGIEGTGLGLSITQELVAIHQGTVEIDSKVGEGTTVTIRIGAAAESQINLFEEAQAS